MLDEVKSNILLDGSINVHEKKLMLKEALGEDVHIVIIDSGVSASHPLLVNCDITQMKVSDNFDGHIMVHGGEDTVGHGTAICAIIATALPKAKITMIKIYDDVLSAHVDKLVFALEYIDKNLECDVINLSVGTRVSTQELYSVCEALTQKGVIITAAYDNAGGISYPAEYGNVIGVDAASRLTHVDDFIVVKNSIVNLLAKGGNQRLAWTQPLYIINQGSSFSVPHATVMAAKFVELNIGASDIIHAFEQIAEDNYIAPLSEMKKLKRKFSPTHAYLFPFNKEMHSLLRFSDLLPFEISGVLDIRQSANVGKAVKVYGSNTDITIRDIEKIEWECMGALVLGHVHELKRFAKKDLKRMVLEKCLQYGINVYTFDMELVGEYEEAFNNSGIILDGPFQNEAFGLTDRFGMLYTINSPVLGIFGTTSQQGKFTLQLQLRQYFLKDGYKFAQLGTEPSAKLFGFDEVFPYGYAGAIKEQGLQTIQYVNQLMHAMDSEEPDIIIVGAQSGSVPLFCNNLGQIPLYTIEFFIGAAPDAVILCINPFDDIGYIKRTISVMENLIPSTKVISLCMFPMDMPNGWHIMNNRKQIMPEDVLLEAKHKLEQEIGIDVFINGCASEMNLLYNKCIDFFAV